MYFNNIRGRRSKDRFKKRSPSAKNFESGKGVSDRHRLETESDLLVINFVKITMRACGCVVQSLTSVVTARNSANKRVSER